MLVNPQWHAGLSDGNNGYFGGSAMKDTIFILPSLMAFSLVTCVGSAMLDPGGSPGSTQTPAGTQAGTRGQGQANVEKQRSDAQKQARPDLEKQRQEAQRQGEQNLDKDAVAAIQETRNAINAIAANNTSEALAAIERATGKINVLTARNPATALIPVGLEVVIIDAAPTDTQRILEIAIDASRAMDSMNFPAARVLLDELRSEIRVRTSHLPLATYPDALKEAASLLDQKRNQEASKVLLTALNTLVIVDRVVPIPLLAAREAIDQAQAQAQKDRAAAQKLLETARGELLRAMALGYAGKDPEYKALNDQIASVEKQLKRNQDITAILAGLKQKFAAFFKRQSEQKQTQPPRQTAQQQR